MAAVSIQLTPNSTACRIAPMECSSSCFPHPKDHPPPPIAQAPSPTVVISIPPLPKDLFLGAITSPSFVQLITFPIYLFRSTVSQETYVVNRKRLHVRRSIQEQSFDCRARPV